MNNSGSNTHKPRAIDPQRFRAQATGITSCQSGSEASGAMRAAEVVEHMPPAQRRAVPLAEGYPAPSGPYEKVEPGYEPLMAAQVGVRY